jgi:serine/threonine protein kinase
LHGADLLHGDLRCDNILIDDNNDAQIIDISDGYGYTPGWHAYTDNVRDKRRDIYSFGVTLWELIHDGDRPPSISTSLPIDWRGKQFDDTWVDLIEHCTLEYADKRPSMEMVLEILDAQSMCGCDGCDG